MALGKWVVILVVWTSSWTLNTADVGLSCVFMESCILPCSFPAGADVVIQWIQVTTGGTTVHSYYSNQDWFIHQNQRFRGRTFLFNDQISRGNASLRLTGVEVQDQGRYKCYTGTSTETQTSFINVLVDAPVRKVDIQQVENRITCSSEGIYPEPELTWSPNVTLQNKASVLQSEQKLYSISSSVMVSDTDPVYSCTVSTLRNKRRATWFQPTSINSSDGETTIDCRSTNAPLTGLVWRFNHSQVILNRTGADASYTVPGEWRQQVKNVWESGSLTLQTSSPDQEGMYSCELSDAEETYITNTILKIITPDDPKPNVAAIVGGVVGGVFLVLAVIGVAVYCIYKRIKSRRPTETTPDRIQSNGQQEQIPLNNMKGDKDENDEETLKTEGEPNEH